MSADIHAENHFKKHEWMKERIDALEELLAYFAEYKHFSDGALFDLKQNEARALLGEGDK